MRHTIRAALVALAMTLGLAGPAAAIEFGVNVHAPKITNLQQAQADTGRELDTTRVFFRWNENPRTDEFLTYLNGTATVPMVSVQAARTDGSRISWRAIADAQIGSPLRNDMVRWAQAFRDYGKPIRVTFNHEASVIGNLGSASSDAAAPSEFIAAWRTFRTVIRNQQATNVRFLWIETAHAFNVTSADRRYAPRWYPGDAYVDLIGADLYNWGDCRDPNGPWQSFEYVARGFERFAAAHPSEVPIFPEWASVEDSDQPGRKATWIREAGVYLRSHPQFKAVSWFNSKDYNNPTCLWEYDSTPESQQAFREVAQGA